jgi:succinate dehydrogenase / fumarate reductase, cytochrome b subunit
MFELRYIARSSGFGSVSFDLIAYDMSAPSPSFFMRHEFLIRRLHSLSGLIPVGAYMTVHLLVNASLINGAASFQTNVNQIHSLEKALFLVEWAFIFLPLIFHAAVGVWIITTGKSNHDNYRYVNNWRYTLQRWSGVIAIVFIFFHVFHLHGWFHSEWWLSRVAEPWGMARFRPFNASSSLALAMSGFIWPVFYLLGIIACVFHLANGIWTMGITWGVWTSPEAQRRANYVCAGGGLLLLMVGLTALTAAIRLDPVEARAIEDAIYDARVAARQIVPIEHKRLPAEAAPSTPNAATEKNGTGDNTEASGSSAAAGH